MSKINFGWLKNKAGERFAPKTFLHLVMDKSGKSLEKILEEVKDLISNAANSNTGSNNGGAANGTNVYNLCIGKSEYSADSRSFTNGCTFDELLQACRSNAIIHVIDTYYAESKERYGFICYEASDNMVVIGRTSVSDDVGGALYCDRYCFYREAREYGEYDGSYSSFAIFAS